MNYYCFSFFLQGIRELYLKYKTDIAATRNIFLIIEQLFD